MPAIPAAVDQKPSSISESTAPKEIATTAPGQYRVIRRNGKVTAFDKNKIKIAVTKAFLAVEGGNAAASGRIRDAVDRLTEQVTHGLMRNMPDSGVFHIEDIQDQVELALMRADYYKVARAYVLYREERAKARAAQQPKGDKTSVRPTINVTRPDGDVRLLDVERLQRVVNEACDNAAGVEPQPVIADTLRNLYDGVPEHEVGVALTLAARTRIEREPNYTYVAARLLLDNLRREALSYLASQPRAATFEEMAGQYPEYLKEYVNRAAELELLDAKLATEYDLDRLGVAIVPARDHQFTYLGLQTLYDRYFIHSNGTRFELPQAFFMRVAMGLAINEIDREARAIEFYNLLSSFDFMSSTPTLFNAGTLRPQLSSCYLTTVPDDLYGIFESIQDDAMLSKFAGGLGNDWTRVRAMGSHIKGTNGRSQGVVPFLKVANDTAVAVNQCFAPETLVHTADGARPIKSIRTGDLVLTRPGEYREVTAQMVYNQVYPMVELDIKHTIEPVKVTAGHPLWSLRGVPLEQTGRHTQDWLANGKVRPEWIEAGQLRRGDYVAQVIPKEVVPVPGLSDEDARLYGILLGDGHLSKNGQQWGASGNPVCDVRMQFVRDYLAARKIHFWETGQGESYGQIHWAAGRGALCDATTGRITSAGAPTLPFAYDDLYDEQGRKRIGRRFSHLPRSQTLVLVQGLLETDGVSRGKEIYFTSASRPLAEGMRYQLLRLGIPTSGQYRVRRQDDGNTHSDGSGINFIGTVKAIDVRIPAIPEVAALIGCQSFNKSLSPKPPRPFGGERGGEEAVAFLASSHPLRNPLSRDRERGNSLEIGSKRDWIEWNGWIFSRVRRCREIAPTPFVCDLKVEGDASYMTTAGVAHNGGKRKGAMCAYLETWHLDIEEFIELRKNTGDDRRRTHDMNSANWIPDLFIKRVIEDKSWTLFSPNEVPDLHDLYGQAFERRYMEYEEKTARGEIKVFKRIKAVELWRKMLNMLYETGHPWMTFKDPCNLRSPQSHMGQVHCSNLCTEITLNTSDDEIAVCNLGSINLAAHVDSQGLDHKKLEKTVATATRMLDNVIDYNYYSVNKARRANLRHRPVGLGIMGFQDVLYKLRIPYASEAAIEFADRSMEAVSYYAIKASTFLAKERGVYSSFKGSLWSQGVLPIDSIARLEQERGGHVEMDRSVTLDWETLRARVLSVGMRNSNTMAIAPTATISNICGITQSIEPTYQNLFVKSNLSGEFTYINPFLVDDLKQRGLWDEVMVNDLKYYDGSVQEIDRVPADLKELYATAFEIDSAFLVEAASRRQKWIDQAQSLNLYMAQPSGKKMDSLYKLAWKRGLKTTYYLRSLGATHVEKSTMSDGRASKLNAVQSNGLGKNDAPKVCAIKDPDCEACQ
jgi:ribonucleoside-diphosphate reductase alpha chain